VNQKKLGALIAAMAVSIEATVLYVPEVGSTLLAKSNSKMVPMTVPKYKLPKYEEESVSIEEVAHTLKKAPHLSSPGPDTCPDGGHLNSLLTQALYSTFSSPLTETITKASISHVILLHKAGHTDEVTNYRPISLRYSMHTGSFSHPLPQQSTPPTSWTQPTRIHPPQTSNRGYP